MTVLRRFAGALLVGLLAAGCSAEAPEPADSSAPPTTAAATRSETISLERPFTLHVPTSLASGQPAPLAILLHGYTSSGQAQENYLRLAPEAGRRGILYAIPDGTKNSQGTQFWNATEACCNFYGSTVDDTAYLREIITAVSAKYPVDTDRVYLIGHSNGAFMSFRMACDHAELIAGIVALNGAMLNDPSACTPSRPVSTLHIRGTADETILNDGGETAPGLAYPSTTRTVADWVGFDGCATSPDTSAAPLDLESTIAGAETEISRYTGCQGGSAVEVWTMKDGSHIPTLTAAFAPAVFDFLAKQSL